MGRGLEETCGRFATLTMHTLPGWRRISGPEIAAAAGEVGLVRILGLDCPMDVFRRPNEFEEDSFEEVFRGVTRNADGTWLPDPLDLAISKDQTNRDKDIHDINFLEGVVRERWIKLLPAADFPRLGPCSNVSWIGAPAKPHLPIRIRKSGNWRPAISAISQRRAIRFPWRCWRIERFHKCNETRDDSELKCGKAMCFLTIRMAEGSRQAVGNVR